MRGIKKDESRDTFDTRFQVLDLSAALGRKVSKVAFTFFIPGKILIPGPRGQRVDWPTPRLGILPAEPWPGGLEVCKLLNARQGPGIPKSWLATRTLFSI